MRPSREIVARGVIFEDLRLRVQRGIQETAGSQKTPPEHMFQYRKLRFSAIFAENYVFLDEFAILVID